jgi:hypothetical protein
MCDWHWGVARNAVDDDDYATGSGSDQVEVIPLKGLGGPRRRLPFEPQGRKSTYIAQHASPVAAPSGLAVR